MNFSHKRLAAGEVANDLAPLYGVSRATIARLWEVEAAPMEERTNIGIERKNSSKPVVARFVED